MTKQQFEVRLRQLDISLGKLSEHDTTNICLLKNEISRTQAAFKEFLILEGLAALNLGSLTGRSLTAGGSTGAPGSPKAAPGSRKQRRKAEQIAAPGNTAPGSRTTRKPNNPQAKRPASQRLQAEEVVTGFSELVGSQ